MPQTSLPKLTESEFWEKTVSEPSFFRNNLVIDTDGINPLLLGDHMDDWQKKDFDAIDPCLKYVAGHTNKPPPYQRFWRQRARGHSKTTDCAIDLTWLLLTTNRPLDGISASGDRDQAKLVREQMEKIARTNQWLFQILDYQRNTVINKNTGAKLTIISSDVASSWGITPDFVFADELTHWEKDEFWHSIISSFAKREKRGMIIVGCNAGFGYDWKWQAKQFAISSPLWYHSSPKGTIASWMSQSMLDEQKALLPRGEYARLWENEWQETGGTYVTLAETQACCDDKLKPRIKCEQDGWKYIASLDYAPKHDRTVGTVMHQIGETVIVDKMDVICPKVTGVTTRIEWVRDWCMNVEREFGGDYGQVVFVFDQYQLLGTMQQLEDEGLWVETFEFASGVGNWKMAIVLRHFIIEQKVKWYPDCGVLRDREGNIIDDGPVKDDLENELASLVVVNYSNGKRWRFDHIQDNYHHDDRCYSLGAGLYWLVDSYGGLDEWGVTPPDESGNFRY